MLDSAKRYLSLTVVAALAVTAAHANQGSEHAVFVMTNDADHNEIYSYAQNAQGRLENERIYPTAGRGSGGTVDPLATQGSLSLSSDANWLLASNAGSGTVSAFLVSGSQLYLTDQVTSDGAEPNSIAQKGQLVYVLNAAGASSVVGFWFDSGRLRRIPDSIRYLSGTAVGPGSVAFSPDGKWLAVTEKATASIDIFSVQPDGTLSQATVNKNVGPGTFSATFSPTGTLVVAETGAAGATNGSALSTYLIQPDGTLKAVSTSVPTLAAATCWDVVLDGGKFIYTSNAGTSNLSGFSLGANGGLTPLSGTIAASNPAGSTNIDVAASADGKYVYTLNTAAGTIGVFAVNASNGQLTNLGVSGHLPASSGANGMVAH
jgi:6-phosphogluconolactonase